MAPQFHRGHWGGGVTNSKVLGSCQTAAPIGTKFGTRRRIRLGMDLGYIQFAHSTPGRISGGGGLGGHQFKTLWKLSNGWTDWPHIWYTSVDSSGKRHRLNSIRPSIPQGAFPGGGGVAGHTFKKSWEAVKRLDRLAPHLVHVCVFVWEWT